MYVKHNGIPVVGFYKITRDHGIGPDGRTYVYVTVKAHSSRRGIPSEEAAVLGMSQDECRIFAQELLAASNDDSPIE